MLLLIRENPGLMGIRQIIIDHAPHGSFPGAGCESNGLNRMLTVENIIDPIPNAHLHGIDLEDVEILNHFQNGRLRQIPLILLIRI